MSNDQNFANRACQNEPSELSNLNFIQIPASVNIDQNLAPLNAVSSILVPTGQKYWGVFEFKEETQIYPNQLILPQSRLMNQLLQPRSVENMISDYGRFQMPSEIHNSSLLHQCQYFHKPEKMTNFEVPAERRSRTWGQGFQEMDSQKLMPPTYTREDIRPHIWSEDPVLPNPKSSDNINSSFDSPAESEVISLNEENSNKACSSCKFCTCGLEKDQAHLVKRVLTPNNMRFLERLKGYEYEIKGEISHLSGKPLPKYVCKYKDVCNKEFERTWKLLDHCRTHFGIKPYSCDVCGRKFTQKGNRNKHMLRHH